MRRLLLWRHGRTAWNAERRFQGHADVPLDVQGQGQAAAAATLLAVERPDVIVSSDLLRATQTAAALSERTGLPVRLDARLRETGLGGWEGLTAPEIEAAYPDEWRSWQAGETVRRGGGELREEVASRALAALADIDGEVVVLVTHGGTAKVLAASLLGLPLGRWRVLAPLSNCHWSELRSGPDGWRLDRHNVGPSQVADPGGDPPAVDAEEPAVVAAEEPTVVADVPDL